MSGPAGRVVLVTGASSGIGRAAVDILLAQGDSVALFSRSEQVLATVAGDHPHALVTPGDVTVQDDVERAVQSTVQRFGRLDAVVHSAQVMAYGRIEDVPREVYERVVDVAMKGLANVARVVLPRFREQHGGQLVVVNSLLGEIATPRMGAYDAAKWGQLGLARVLQLEVRGERGVDVSIVSPGAIDTPIYEQAANVAGRGAYPPPPVVSAQRVAAAAVRCIAKPRRHVEVGAINVFAVLGFRLLPAVFDRLVGPLVHLFVFRGAPSGPYEGNVLTPQPGREDISGGWTRFGRARADRAVSRRARTSPLSSPSPAVGSPAASAPGSGSGDAPAPPPPDVVRPDVAPQQAP